MGGSLLKCTSVTPGPSVVGSAAWGPCPWVPISALITPVVTTHRMVQSRELGHRPGSDLTPSSVPVQSWGSPLRASRVSRPLAVSNF